MYYTLYFILFVPQFQVLRTIKHYLFRFFRPIAMNGRSIP